jgi:cation:H+ antiporter
VSLGLAAAVFAVSALVVIRAGTALAANGDQIAEKTGLGRLFVGTLILAFATSLPELVTDVTAVLADAPDLAIADLFGSSMANMAILAIIDLRHRGRVWPVVELGHTRVAAVAVTLTGLALLGMHTGPVAVGWVGVMPILIVALYIAAVAWFRKTAAIGRSEPSSAELMQPTGWPEETDVPPMRTLLLRFGAATAVILAAAPAMTLSAERIADLTGVAQTAIGIVLLAFTTSFPELSASLAACRIGAYDLAVGNLFGSNAANMALIFFVDLAYTDGPVLAAVSPSLIVAGIGAIVLTALAAASIVGGTETRWKRLEPDAAVLLAAYLALVGMVIAIS